jgi:acyl carrier protein
MPMADLEQSVLATIGEVFGIDPNTIGRSTVAEDVDGWDSLSHTILILRLEKVLKVRIDDQIAQNAANVGELIDAIHDQMAFQSP